MTGADWNLVALIGGLMLLGGFIGMLQSRITRR